MADLIRHISFAQNKKSGHPLCTHTHIYMSKDKKNTAAGLIVTILSYNDFVFKVKLLQKKFFNFWLKERRKKKKTFEKFVNF